MALNIRALMGAPLTSTPETYVEDVFSSYLYTGNNGTQTINNGINLSGEGGMLWVKGRAGGFSSYWHNISDSARGNRRLFSNNGNSDNPSGYYDTALTPTMTSSGFTLYNDPNYNGSLNTYVSWSFRKAPKFFDVVTWTGNGASIRFINHSLGIKPGLVIIKCTSASTDWSVAARNSSGLNAGQSDLLLNTTANDGQATQGFCSLANSTSTYMWLNDYDGNAARVNASGQTYVAYIFAHNPTSNGIIQCGSYDGNSSATGPTVTLGWEPQWLLIKRATFGTGSWHIIDNMRGMPVGSADAPLYANIAGSEGSSEYVTPTATGFQIASADAEVNASGSSYVYIAIRRGPMRIPTSGTSVYNYSAGQNTSTKGDPVFTPGFAADMFIEAWRNGNAGYTYDRLRNRFELSTASTGPDQGPTGYRAFDNSTTIIADTQFYNFGSNNIGAWLFRRAPSFFDIVCYTGIGSATTVRHNLGVVPEMFVVKSRTQTGISWIVYHKDTGISTQLLLNSTSEGTGPYNGYWNGVLPTRTAFSLGTDAGVNGSGERYVSYLFASCPGVSKVGSYTGNGSTQTINCSFTTGARFVMIKRTDVAGDWYIWDTARGIVSGNDPHLSINTGAAEVSSDDSIDPASSGFIVNQLAATNINVSSGSYIYFAIA